MITALWVMIAIAVVLGVVLGYAAIRFRVEGNPLVEKIDAVLPQTQWPVRLSRLQTLRRSHRQG